MRILRKETYIVCDWSSIKRVLLDVNACSYVETWHMYCIGINVIDNLADL